MTADTKNTVKQLKKELKELNNELKGLSFVTEDETGYISYELEYNPNGDIEDFEDFSAFEKEYESLQNGEKNAGVTVIISTVGSICGNSTVDLNQNDIYKIDDGKYKAHRISAKIARVRRNMAKQRKIQQKERELENLKNSREVKPWCMGVFCDEEFY